MDKLERNYKEVISYELDSFTGKRSYQLFWRIQRTNYVLHNLKLLVDPEENNLIGDIGCGPGIVSSIFAQKGYNILGIDKVKPFIEFASLYFKKKKITGEFISADITGDNIVFSSKNLEAIICIDAIEHFKKPVKAVNNFKNLLGEKGYVILTTPNFGSTLFSFIEMLWDFIGRTPGWHELHVTRLNLKKLTQLFKNSGFNILKKGTFLFLSPMISVFSRRIARFFSYIEAYFLKKVPIGFMLYLVAKV